MSKGRAPEFAVRDALLESGSCDLARARESRRGRCHRERPYLLHPTRPASTPGSAAGGADYPVFLCGVAVRLGSSRSRGRCGGAGGDPETQLQPTDSLTCPRQAGERRGRTERSATMVGSDLVGRARKGTRSGPVPAFIEGVSRTARASARSSRRVPVPFRAGNLRSPPIEGGVSVQTSARIAVLWKCDTVSGSSAVPDALACIPGNAAVPSPARDQRISPRSMSRHSPSSSAISRSM